MIADLGEGYSIRHATAEDRAALSEICLKTGDAGNDATAREDDPELLGLLYTLPYQALEPEFSFVLQGPERVCGYVLGTPDSRAFNQRMAAEWFSGLRARYRDPGEDEATWRGSDWARAIIYRPPMQAAAVLDRYPGHGHIDLLPEAQGKGFGRSLVTLLEDALRAHGVPGLHFQLDPRNLRALGFYQAVGYEALTGGDIPDDALYVGKRLR